MCKFDVGVMYLLCCLIKKMLCFERDVVFLYVVGWLVNWLLRLLCECFGYVW